MTYERTVAAAVAETKSKFALAEALAEDIPPRRGRTADDETSTRQYLEEARQEVVDAGGEERSVERLSKYRQTALWVMALSGTSFQWVPGASFTAHLRAMEYGLSYDDFVNKDVKTGDAAAEAAGRGAIRGTSAIKSWSSEQKAEAARELLAEPEVAEHVVQDKAARASVSRATDEHYRKQAAERAQRTEQKTNADPVGQRIDSAKAVNDLGEACERFSRDGNEALRRVGELPESERYWLTGAVDRAEATARAARRYLELGRSEIDTEINALLENGA